MPKSKPPKDPSRRFDAYPAPSGTVFVIEEVPSDYVSFHAHPEAWLLARSQPLPVIFLTLDRRQRSCGTHFDPRDFERLVHYYWQTSTKASVVLRVWPFAFRKDPQKYLKYSPEFLQRSLDAYLAVPELSEDEYHSFFGD